MMTIDMTQSSPLTSTLGRITQSQSLLLRACLWQDERAIAAWQAWINQVDIEHLDGGSDRLLPLLYRNLTRLGIDHPVMTRLKGIYRHTWSKNQLRLARLRQVLELFTANGIKSTLLKGCSLISFDYEDCGVRPMQDLDVWVLPEDFRQAVDILIRDSWIPKDYPKEIVTLCTSLRHATGFTDKNGWGLDLHWRVFHGDFTTADNIALWHNRQSSNIFGFETWGLCPTERLLHICVHGMRWNYNPHCYWVADAAVLIQRNSIDWDYFCQQASILGVKTPAFMALNKLNQILENYIPHGVLVELSKLEQTQSSSRLYKILTQSPEQRYRQNLLEILLMTRDQIKVNYRLFQQFFHASQGRKGTMIEFLLAQCRATNIWQIPGYLFAKVIMIFRQKIN